MAIGRPHLPRVHDRVLFFLSVCGWLALIFGGFLDSAPNRLARTAAFSLWQAPLPGMAAVVAALAIVSLGSCIGDARKRAHTGAAGGSLLLIASLFAAGRFAAIIGATAAPAARQSTGLAFWALLAVSLLAITQSLYSQNIDRRGQITYVALLGLAVASIAASGILDHLSLVQEFQSHRAIFAAAFIRHLYLVAASLFFALLVGIPLSLLVLRRAKLRGPVFSGLNILQTIPSIAIFGLLIAPLSALSERLPFLGRLGINGTGATPAIIALTLYALLPLVRNFSTGIAEVPVDVKDAARGLGFNGNRIFFDVELPLAMPALLSGLRIVTVQSIGLAAVAALIGAGGLGTFVFQGIGEYAIDLVLLGALPIIALALVADGGFRLLLIATRKPA